LPSRSKPRNLIWGPSEDGSKFEDMAMFCASQSPELQSEYWNASVFTPETIKNSRG
jgi:hypothetical protein